MMDLMLALFVAESVPLAPGGHPVKCAHKKHPCKCATCVLLITDCTRCQKRLKKSKLLARRIRARR